MKYYLVKNGASTGPFESAEVAAKIRSGEVYPNDLCVPDDGSTAWKPVSAYLPAETAGAPVVSRPADTFAAPAAPGFPSMAAGGARAGMMRFFQLREMITPTFIQIIYIVGLAGIALFSVIVIFIGLLTMFKTDPYGRSTVGTGLLAVVGGLVGVVIYAILWRVYCEILIVIFRIHDLLRDIRDGMKPPR